MDEGIEIQVVHQGTCCQPRSPGRPFVTPYGAELTATSTQPRAIVHVSVTVSITTRKARQACSMATEKQAARRIAERALPELLRLDANAEVRPTVHVQEKPRLLWRLLLPWPQDLDFNAVLFGRTVLQHIRMKLAAESRS